MYIKKSTILIFLPLFSISIVSPVDCFSDDRVTVVFRYDDFSEHSSTGLEEKIIEIFQRNGLVLSMGVIPFVWADDGHDPARQRILPLTPSRAAFLLAAVKKGCLEIAQHGYSHQTVRRKPHPVWSEFIGYDYTEFYGVELETQLELLEKGKKHLEEIFCTRITTFIPPWNSYDRNTILALDSAGFKCISAAARGYYRQSSRIKYMPGTCSINRLLDTIKKTEQIKGNERLIVVMMHPFGFTLDEQDGNRITMNELEKILLWIQSRKNITVKTISQVVESDEDLSARRFSSYNSYCKALYVMPDFLDHSLKRIYLSSENARKLAYKAWIIISAVCLSLLITGFVLGRFIKRIAASNTLFKKRAVFYLGIPFCFTLLLICLVFILPAVYLKITAAAVFAGSILGSLEVFLKKN